MAGSALWATQTAVYGVLAGDATLQTLLGTTTSTPYVFDSVPDNQAYPYVVIGDLGEQRDDTVGRTGKRIALPVVGVSSYPGNSQIHSIINRIAALLDRQALTITGYSHIKTLHRRTTPARQESGGVVVRVGVIEFEIIVSEAA